MSIVAMLLLSFLVTAAVFFSPQVELDVQQADQQLVFGESELPIDADAKLTMLGFV
jgi:hypothetical protein